MTTETTQSAPQPVPRRLRWAWQIAVGVLLAPGAFLFGGFMALPALVVILPGLRRFWPLGLSLFLGVMAVRGLALAGVNPATTFARDRALARMEALLGGPVSYDDFHGDAINGELHFTGLHARLASGAGELGLDSLDVNAGRFLLYRPDGYLLHGTNLAARVDASGGKLEDFFNNLKTPDDTETQVKIEQGSVEVYGSPTTARLTVSQINGGSGENGWVLNVGLTHAVVTLLDRPSELELAGGITVGDNGGGLRIQADLRAVDPEVGSGILSGTLRPGGESAMVCTLDRVDLKPLWARWRKVDTYGGTLRGHVSIGGDLNHLAFEFGCEVSDYSYYHYTAMGLDPQHSFELPKGDLSGRLLLLDGERWKFEGVTLSAPDATLATGEHMNARGGGQVELDGVFPDLKGKLTATVESGEIHQPISWSILSNDGLSDVEPNIIIVAEQFSKLELDWELEVKQLDVACEPVTGSLSGKLTGTFVKQPGQRRGVLRANGDLELRDGRVKCLGIDGELNGKLEFRDNRPTYHAALHGKLTAKLGATPIDCEVLGDLQHPVFVFSGAKMSPEDLSRNIYAYSAEELTPAQKVERSEQCGRIFGIDAARRESPFYARNGGRVSFIVK